MWFWIRIIVSQASCHHTIQGQGITQRSQGPQYKTLDDTAIKWDASYYTIAINQRDVWEYKPRHK